VGEQARLDDRIGDQHREVGDVLGDERVVDRDPLPVEPARVVPGQGSAPARAGEGERDPGKVASAGSSFTMPRRSPAAKLVAEARAKTGVEFAAGMVPVPIFEPFSGHRARSWRSQRSSRTGRPGRIAPPPSRVPQSRSKDPRVQAPFDSLRSLMPASSAWSRRPRGQRRRQRHGPTPNGPTLDSPDERPGRGLGRHPRSLRTGDSSREPPARARRASSPPAHPRPARTRA
jgi:hypothetical protein